MRRLRDHIGHYRRRARAAARSAIARALWHSGRRPGASLPPRRIALITGTRLSLLHPGNRHEPHMYKSGARTLTLWHIAPNRCSHARTHTGHTARADTLSPPSARPGRRPRPGCPRRAPRPPPGCSAVRTAGVEHGARAHMGRGHGVVHRVTDDHGVTRRLSPRAAARWRSMCSALLPPEGPVRPSTRTKWRSMPYAPHDRDQVLVAVQAEQRLAAAAALPLRPAAPRRPRSSAAGRPLPQ